jgi:hypothetical protein
VTLTERLPEAYQSVLSSFVPLFLFCRHNGRSTSTMEIVLVLGSRCQQTRPKISVYHMGTKTGATKTPKLEENNVYIHVEILSGGEVKF